MLPRLVLFTAISALATVPALAQQSGGAQQLPSDLPAFAQVDKDGDGLMNWEEAKAVGIPRSFFKQEDHDNNGLISKPTYKYKIKRLAESN